MELKEFWEKCGFKKAGSGWTDIVYKYPIDIDPPNPLDIFDGKYDRLPELTLDNLFKYATERVRIKIGDIEYAKLLKGWCRKLMLGEDPAQALKKALEQVL